MKAGRTSWPHTWKNGCARSRRPGPGPRTAHGSLCHGQTAVLHQRRTHGNELVQVTAGGHSVNREIPARAGPAGPRAGQLQALQPDVMLVSAFISSPVQDLLDECLSWAWTSRPYATGVSTIFRLQADFGSPRWIPPPMHIAGILHPECCAFDIPTEAETFHQCFYGTPSLSPPT